MNPNCKYEVHTYWGWFRLDVGHIRIILPGSFESLGSLESRIRANRSGLIQSMYLMKRSSIVSLPREAMHTRCAISSLLRGKQQFPTFPK